MTVKEALDFLSRHVPHTYPDADTALLCGSTVSGKATPQSDLDLVVVFPALPDGAFRETVGAEGWLIEVFGHDPGTLDYFIRRLDIPGGVPILANMISEGIPVPGLQSRLLDHCKQLAAKALAEGPPIWDRSEIDRRRYTISNLADDLHSDLSVGERLAIAAELWTKLGEFALRASGNFSGAGKGLARALESHDPILAEALASAISNLLRTGQEAPLQTVVDTILAPYGGRLVAGYRAVAPTDWRTD